MTSTWRHCRYSPEKGKSRFLATLGMTFRCVWPGMTIRCARCWTERDPHGTGPRVPNRAKGRIWFQEKRRAPDVLPRLQAPLEATISCPKWQTVVSYVRTDLRYIASG